MAASIRYGCQTYTWQMSAQRFAGKVEHIAETIRRSGLVGMEPELAMLGDYANQPERLRHVLDASGIALGGLCLVCDWRDACESRDERAFADATITMLKTYFPDCALILCQMPGPDRADLPERQRHALACLHAVARRASDAGITVSFHPNSPPGSVFRNGEDYALLLDQLDDRYLGFAPDAGHIAKGGMDPVQVIQAAGSRVRHVHFKDMDARGSWVEMGHGIINFPGIVRVLKASGYQGWIMIEDESELAERDPDAATIANGRYITTSLAD